MSDELKVKGVKGLQLAFNPRKMKDWKPIVQPEWSIKPELIDQNKRPIPHHWQLLSDFNPSSYIQSDS